MFSQNTNLLNWPTHNSSCPSLGRIKENISFSALASRKQKPRHRCCPPRRIQNGYGCPQMPFHSILLCFPTWWKRALLFLRVGHQTAAYANTSSQEPSGSGQPRSACSHPFPSLPNAAIRKSVLIIWPPWSETDCCRRPLFWIWAPWLKRLLEYWWEASRGLLINRSSYSVVLLLYVKATICPVFLG